MVSKVDTTFNKSSTTLPCLWTNVTSCTAEESCTGTRCCYFFYLKCISSLLRQVRQDNGNRNCYPAELGVTCPGESLFAYCGRSSAGVGNYHFTRQKHPTQTPTCLCQCLEHSVETQLRNSSAILKHKLKGNFPFKI